MADIEVHKKASFTGHSDSIYCLENTDNVFEFFSSGADGMVVLWNLNNPDTGKLIAKTSNSIYCLKYLKDENHLLVGQNFEGLHLIDVNTKKELKSIKLGNSYYFDIEYNDLEILVASGTGELLILDKISLTIKERLNFSTKSARCIAFHPFLDLYAISYSDHTIKIFQRKKNELLHTINAHQNSIFTISFSPDGRFLISGGRDARLNIWDCENQFTLHQSIVAHMYAINNIQYSETGKYFATCSMDKTIKVWDAREFKLLKVIDRARHAGHGTSVNKLLWLQENVIISASDDNSISVWDLNFNEEKR